MNDGDVLLVISSFPDRDTAVTVARELVERRLAACVNVQSPCESVYRWEGRLETAGEIPVFMKTTRERYAALEAMLRDVHPYEVPEIIALPVTAGLPAYLDWVASEAKA